MNKDELSIAARTAIRAGDWRTTGRLARQILDRDRNDAEGHFLKGLAEKTAGRTDTAAKSFLRALRQDENRYDAAIELADMYVREERNTEALALLQSHESQLGNSPLYLEMAARIYSRLDLHEQAFPLYRAACELQPEIEQFRAGLAANNVFLGRIAEARSIYESLLGQYPQHQRYHYELSQLGKAQDGRHVEQMEAVLATTAFPAPRNIFLYYAIGKELEDLGEWDRAFGYYEQAGNAARSVSPYDVAADLELIEAVIRTCTEDWLARGHGTDSPVTEKLPIFVVGLPRTGTTLTERIIGSHSRVRSIGETFFLQMAVRQESGVRTTDAMNPKIIEAAARRPPGGIGARYLEAVRYKLGTEEMFIEKLPENYLYLGFILREFPDARIVHLKRHPMDACFAMFKQSYFRFAYTLDDVGRYYVAYDHLMRHWREVLGDRLTEVEYEALVADQEAQTRRLLERLGLDFEEACLEFERSETPTRTASAVQVREKMHTRSVGRWRHFERHLVPLQDYLTSHGIEM